MNGIQHLTTPTCLKFCLGIMLFIWPQLLKIWPQLSPVWPQLLSFGERDGDNFFTARANPAFPKRQILDSSKLKEFIANNFKIDGNCRKFSKQIENTVGKGEIARYEQFLLFPQCFQKTCTAYT